MKVSHRNQERVDQQTMVRVGIPMSLKNGSRTMGSWQGFPPLLCVFQPYSFSLSSTCHLYLNCCHDLCYYGRETQLLSGLNFTQHSFCYLDKQRHLSQNKILNAGSYFYEPMQAPSPWAANMIRKCTHMSALVVTRWPSRGQKGKAQLWQPE